MEENIFDTDFYEDGEDLGEYDLSMDCYKNKIFILQKIFSLCEFKEGKYKVYEDVAVKHLKAYLPDNESYPAAASLDLVICQDNSIKCCLMFKRANREGQSRFLELLAEQVTVITLYNNRFAHENVQNWSTRISQSSNVDKSTILLSTIPANKIIEENRLNEHKTTEICSQEVLIKTTNIYERHEKWTETRTENNITEFGKDCGLIKRWFISSKEELSEQIVCSEVSKKKFADVLNWKDSLKPSNGIKSLKERIQNINNNLPSDERYSINKVEKSVNLPIKIFFKQAPNELTGLKEIIEAYDKKLSYVTYQDVAVIIGNMFEDNYERAEAAMLLLAKPYLNEFQRRINHSKGLKKEKK